MPPLEDLPNLGPASARMLREVGIADEAALRETGAIAAYARLRAVFGKRVTRNFLRALDGALTGVDWRRLPVERLTELKRAAEEIEEKQKRLAGGRK